jgi:hypothetical protein
MIPEGRWVVPGPRKENSKGTKDSFRGRKDALHHECGGYAVVSLVKLIKLYA